MKIDHAKLQDEEREQILRQCAEAGLDIAACEAMTFRALRDMWTDYQSNMGETA